MELAVNYSYPAEELVRSGQIHIDRFKCPAWPSLTDAVRQWYPLYVHFPLGVGAGIGDAVDLETGRPADWSRVERLFDETGTPLVNVHLLPTAPAYPEIPPDSLAPAHVDRIAENMLRDLSAVVARWGAERVIAENDPGGPGPTMRAALLPQVIRRVIEGSGCGLLLDLSHARLACGRVGMTPEAYIAGLPVDRLHEVHVTGIQALAGPWLERLAQAGIPLGGFLPPAGSLMDHLPFTETDWLFLDWAFGEIRRGAWRAPWVVTFEYGGVNGWFEVIVDRDTLAEQIPRLRRLVSGAGRPEDVTEATEQR
jgi:uncharacterized protein (UPF0276 family)